MRRVRLFFVFRFPVGVCSVLGSLGCSGLAWEFQAAAQATVRATSQNADRDPASPRPEGPRSNDHATDEAVPLRSLRSLRGTALVSNVVTFP